ncbi:MAG: UbiA-like polyprenyltransferase [Candidatus Melainabacteria bacterium]|nr:UbiA-like polyprenyltransferase [Candidatus Melainabacteria bacterium]
MTACFSLRPLALKIKEYAELVQFEHTVFALPFALSALLLATPPDRWPSAWVVGWVLLAMVGGRTYAMALNRLLDADIDAKNPRTQNRAIPAGRIKRAEGWRLALVSLALLVGATTQLPPLCLQLLPLAVAILSFYSWTKRFTSLCHLVLGLALGSAAVAGWLAVTGSFSGGLPVVFGLAVLFWVAGFDIIYACQDTAFDQREGLHSLPAQLGIAQALWLSRVFHGLSVLCLVVFGIWYHQAWQPTLWGYWLGTLLMAITLVLEHRWVQPHDLSRVNAAFFTLNARISLLFFLLLLLSRSVWLLGWG